MCIIIIIYVEIRPSPTWNLSELFPGNLAFGNFGTELSAHNKWACIKLYTLNSDCNNALNSLS